MGLLGMREITKFKFECPDLYMICLLKAESLDIRKCDLEIEKCEWLSIVYF
jgi:hypothetical protein